MKRVSMNIGTHGIETTASEMRRRLAQTLSKIPGDQVVFFNLTLHMEDYQPPAPAEPTILDPRGFRSMLQGERVQFGELARPEND